MKYKIWDVFVSLMVVLSCVVLGLAAVALMIGVIFLLADAGPWAFTATPVLAFLALATKWVYQDRRGGL